MEDPSPSNFHFNFPLLPRVITILKLMKLFPFYHIYVIYKKYIASLYVLKLYINGITLYMSLLQSTFNIQHFKNNFHTLKSSLVIFECYVVFHYKTIPQCIRSFIDGRWTVYDFVFAVSNTVNSLVRA